MTHTTSQLQSVEDFLPMFSTDAASPKFKLLEKVQIANADKPKAKARTATITGIEYICPYTALINRLGRYGWCYTVSYVYGLTLDQLIQEDPCEGEVTDEFWEGDLESC